MKPRDLAIAAAGGVVGYLVETVHRMAGVWYLPGGGGMPIWIAGVYFLALLGTGEGLRRFERRRPGALQVTPARFAVEALLFAVLFFLPPLLHAHEELLTIVATVYLAARLVFFHARGDIEVVVGIMVGDVMIESILLWIGLYHYTNAAYFPPVPLWLSPLWGGLALGLRRLFAATARG